MITNLVLARHGQTFWNAEGKIQGHKGDQLDPVGLQQSIELARFIRRAEQIHGIAPTSIVISSDLLRAEQTAMMIAEWLEIEWRPDDRLRECSFGSLEGLTVPEAVAQHGEHILPYFKNWGDNYDFQNFGGECRQQVLDRQLDLLKTMLADKDIPTVLWVGHGRSFNTLLSHLWPKVKMIKENCDYRVLPL